jgi:hypothetical protein
VLPLCPLFDLFDNIFKSNSLLECTEGLLVLNVVFHDYYALFL